MILREDSMFAYDDYLVGELFQQLFIIFIYFNSFDTLQSM